MSAIARLRDFVTRHLALSLVLVVAVAPAASGLAYALVAGLGLISGDGAPTLAHVRKLLASGDLVASLGFTLGVAFVATVLAFALALIVAMTLRRLRRGRSFALALITLPLAVPHVVTAALVIQWLGPRGLLARAAWASGSHLQFQGFVFDRLGLGIVLAYAWKEVPWLALVLLAVFEIGEERYERVAATLGAGPLQRFTRIVLPLSWRGSRPAVLVLFAYVIGAFEVPLLLGRSWPPMLSVLAWERLTSVDLARRSEAFVIGIAVTLLITAIAIAASRGNQELL